MRRRAGSPYSGAPFGSIAPRFVPARLCSCLSLSCSAWLLPSAMATPSPPAAAHRGRIAPSRYASPPLMPRNQTGVWHPLQAAPGAVVLSAKGTAAAADPGRLRPHRGQCAVRRQRCGGRPGCRWHGLGLHALRTATPPAAAAAAARAISAPGALVAKAPSGAMDLSATAPGLRRQQSMRPTLARSCARPGVSILLPSLRASGPAQQRDSHQPSPSCQAVHQHLPPPRLSGIHQRTAHGGVCHPDTGRGGGLAGV